MGLGGTRPGQDPGAFAEYVCVGTNDLVPLPDHVPFHVGALLEPLSVAMRAIKMSEMVPGDRVLIIGGGPIGLAICSLAGVFGARQLTISEPTERRRSLATTLGAADTIDPADGDPGELFRSRTGAEPDVVFEAVGRPGMLNTAIAAVRTRGTVVAAGICRVPDTIDHVRASACEATIRFPLFYTIEDTSIVADLIASLRLSPEALVSHRIELAELPEAFAALRAPRDQVKVIVEPRDDATAVERNDERDR
jgi:(R,R)-butanediol dehydrogenase/meso-butanediol dehydrogenase/diacetyl reductase